MVAALCVVLLHNQRSEVDDKKMERAGINDAITCGLLGDTCPN